MKEDNLCLVDYTLLFKIQMTIKITLSKRKESFFPKYKIVNK